MEAPVFRINEAHDAERLAAVFKIHGRLHIADFLESTGANNLLRFLDTTDSWKLLFNSGERLFELDREIQANQSAEQRWLLDRAVYSKARDAFQYRYETIRVPDADACRLARGTIVDAFARFMSQEPAQAFLRTVIGDTDIGFADAQATAYGPGHFLTAHDDNVAGKNRRAAYVLNLSREWPADWGGLLVFSDPGEAIAEAFVPAFNALNLFAVPQRHSVSMVTPFAPRRRYSITGWLRSGARL